MTGSRSFADPLMNDLNAALPALLQLSHELGNPLHGLAILGEGNTSTRLTDGRFLVKASGSNLGTLDASGVVECRSAPILELLARDAVPDAEVDACLLASRVDSAARKPSVEALFHAWLLNLPGVNFVGHTHPLAATGLLCSPQARDFAEQRTFPDAIVCCDVESVLVPYTDPGWRLARTIALRTEEFIARHQRAPRVILLGNHGVITLGRTAEAVLAAMLMTEKSAKIWLAAAAAGGPVFLTPADRARIAHRPDEALRQRVLKL